MIYLLEAATADSTRASSGGRMVPGAFWGPNGGTFGDCIVYVNVPLKGGNAGAIKIEGAKTSPLNLVTDGNAAPLISYKKPGNMPSDAYDAGDVITFSSSGGSEVGAFSAEVIAPSTLTGVGMPEEISLTTPFTVTWDAGDGDYMLVWLSSWPSPGLLSCSVPDTGSYSIPLEALALIPDGNDVAISHTYRIKETTVTDGNSSVKLWVSNLYDNGQLDIVP